VAVNFLTRLISSSSTTSAQRSSFHSALLASLISKFSAHWDPNQPLRGNAYRSILIAEGFIDPILIQAALISGLNGIDKRWFPSDLIIWIDPNEVTYRFGEMGSIAHLPLEESPESVSVSSLPIKMTSEIQTGSSLSVVSPPSLSVSPPSFLESQASGVNEIARIEVH